MKRIRMLFLLLLGIAIFTGCGTIIEDNEAANGDADIENDSGEGSKEQSMKKKPIVRDFNISKQKLKEVSGKSSDANLVSTDFQVNEKNGAVSINFTLRNTSEKPLTLTFSSGQEYDYFIYDENNNLIYQWSAGKMFTMAIREVTLDSGDQIAFSEKWDFTDQEGNQVPAGKYRIEFIVTAKAEAEDGAKVHSNQLSGKADIQKD